MVTDMATATAMEKARDALEVIKIRRKNPKSLSMPYLLKSIDLRAFTCRKAIFHGASVALCTLLHSGNVLAGEWDHQYGLAVREVYTDNVCLDASDEQDEWITTATPSIGLSGYGARGSLNLQAAIEANNLTGSGKCSSNSDGDVENFNPRMNADGNLEIVSNFFYVDASASIQQNTINPFLTSGDTNTNRNLNTNTTYNYAISPYLQHRIAGEIDVYARYTFDDQINSERAVDDSSSNSAFFMVGSASGASRLNWSLSGNYQKVEYDDETRTGNPQNDIASVYASLGYQLNRKWQLIGTIGEDINDFESYDDDVDGSFWTGGFKWAPSARTDVEISTGNRFIGTTPKVVINHRHKHSEFSLNYEKVLTFSRSLRNDTEFYQIIDANGDILLSPEGEPILIGLDQTTVTQSPVVDERLQLGYRWSRGRTTVNLQAVESEQLREEDGYTSTFSMLSFGVNRRLSQNLSANARVVYTENDVASGSERLGADSEVYRFYLGLVKSVGLRTSLSMGYTYSDRQSENANDEYTENRLTFGISMNW